MLHVVINTGSGEGDSVRGGRPPFHGALTGEGFSEEVALDPEEHSREDSMCNGPEAAERLSCLRVTSRQCPGERVQEKTQVTLKAAEASLGTALKATESRVDFTRMAVGSRGGL